MKKKTIIIRADASVKNGTGHVMRCLALAQGLQGVGYGVYFAVSECPDALLKKIRAEKFSILKVKSSGGSIGDAQETAEFAKKKKSRWVVVDGYIFSEKYQQIIKNNGFRLFFIDDYGHCKNYCADVILNQNLYAGSHFYRKIGVSTKILLGTRYALLRKEFLPFRHWKRKIPKTAKNILVTIGGSDPENTTLKILRTVKDAFPGLKIKVIAGGANPHIKSLQREISKFPNFQILKDVSNMPKLMAWADIVFSGGGSTCWEIAFMKLPNIIIYCADNQKPIAISLGSAEVAINLECNRNVSEKKIISTLKRLVSDREARLKMSEKARALVDGEGVDRIIYAMNAPFLRKANREDCRFIWELSNSKSVRESSFSVNPISWKHHKEWFERIINDKNCFFCLAETSDGKPAGQVRFRVDGKDAVISTSLAAEFRGKGYGGMLIAEASEDLFRKFPVKTIHAYIRPENKGSVKSFVNAGFCRTEPDSFTVERNSLHLIMARPAS